MIMFDFIHIVSGKRKVFSWNSIFSCSFIITYVMKIHYLKIFVWCYFMISSKYYLIQKSILGILSRKRKKLLQYAIASLLSLYFASMHITIHPNLNMYIDNILWFINSINKNHRCVFIFQSKCNPFPIFRLHLLQEMDIVAFTLKNFWSYCKQEYLFLLFCSKRLFLGIRAWGEIPATRKGLSLTGFSGNTILPQTDGKHKGCSWVLRRRVISSQHCPRFMSRMAAAWGVLNFKI